MTDIEPHEASEIDAAPAREPRRRRRLDRGLLVASFVIASGMALIIWGFFSAITGDEGIDRPPEIESLSPVENAVQVLQQERIAVDLTFGHMAVLVIDGIEPETTNIGEIETEPGQLVTLPPTAIFDPGSSVISFQPSDDAVITEFSQGRHDVQVIYWRIDEGRENASRYRWSFVVV
ncbi:MAG: hypothetical protein HKN44_12200 [Ilumatobacter sp.]|nr:hypothetical protein [Ilumatobacter sp.]